MRVLKVSIISLIENVKAPALVVCAVWGTGNLIKNQVDIQQKDAKVDMYSSFYQAKAGSKSNSKFIYIKKQQQILKMPLYYFP